MSKVFVFAAMAPGEVFDPWVRWERDLNLEWVNMHGIRLVWLNLGLKSKVSRNSGSKKTCFKISFHHHQLELGPHGIHPVFLPRELKHYRYPETPAVHVQKNQCFN